LATSPSIPSPQGPGNEGGEVTRLLRAWQQGDREAAERLMPLVLGELH
jgi:hypothetical protein